MEVKLTSAQAKFFTLVVSAAEKDEELMSFLTTYASGKTFVMERIIEALTFIKRNRNISKTKQNGTLEKTV